MSGSSMSGRTDEAGEEAEADQLLLLDAGDLRIRMMSAAARAALGYGEAEMAELGFFDLAPEITPAAWARLVRRIAGRPDGTAAFRTRLRCRAATPSPRRSGCTLSAMRRVRSSASRSLQAMAAAARPAGSMQRCCAW